MAGLGSPTFSPTSPSFTLDAHHISPERHYPNRKRAGSSNASSRALLQSALSPGRASYGHRPKTASTSSRNTQSSRSTNAANRTGQRDVRTLPPWIDSVEDDDDDDLEYTNNPSERLLSSLSKTHSAEHHYNPSKPTRRISQDGYVDDYEDASKHNDERKDTGFFGGYREPERGRKWDHARDRDPIIMQAPIQSSTWRNYIQASMYGPGLEEEGEKVEPSFLEEQTPGYQKPWRGDMGTTDGGPDSDLSYFQSEKRRRNLYKRIQDHLIMHPLVPLFFRLIVLSTSAIALGLSASVHYLSEKYKYSQNPSTTMAIVVDIVAVPYLLYITWDEYTGKPLGLRSPKAKIRLVLLDLFFIIFESANLALAFAALTDKDGSCTATNNGYSFVICGRVKALCGILMVALIAWSLTFTVSIYRLVERVGGREDHQ